MSDYIIREIPEMVDAAIAHMFSDQPKRGHTSPRQRWLRTLICIGAVGPERASSVFDLWNCALHIARRRSGEEDLRSVESVRGKFLQEVLEFDKALAAYRQGNLPLVRLMSRLANILYYSVQDYVQDYDIRDLNAVAALFCQRAGFPETVAWRCAAVKFLDRAPRDEKDSSAEERSMQAVLEQFAVS